MLKSRKISLSKKNQPKQKRQPRREPSPRCLQEHKIIPNYYQNGANINGVWNLVLADSNVNRKKSSKVPEKRFLKRLFNRNEFYIASKHPLAETIINQTGANKDIRKRFLEKHYNLAIENSIQTWKPSIELIGTF